jgi:hypothetical protein
VTAVTGELLSDQVRHRASRWRWVVAVLIVVVAAGLAVGLTDPFAGSPSSKGVVDNADPTGLQTVTRQSLSEQTQVSATLGYTGNYGVVNQSQGILTSLPTVGQLVSQGQVLYEVSGAPVVLLSGNTPAYRSLSEGTTGADVTELNGDLVALGYATTTEIPSGTDDFTYWTKVGVEKLQAALGVTQNGTVALGQVVFGPTAIRVTSVTATLGAPAQTGQSVLTATSTTRQVSIALDADEQSEVAVGDKVIITLPNNQTTPGVISSVGTVATAGQNGGTSTITVLVNPTDPAATGTWDQAPVEVTISTGGVNNALVVPVDSLLAQANGGYAVEVVDANGLHHLVPVTLGLFDDADGLLQVTGTSLAVGQQIVVPAL